MIGIRGGGSGAVIAGAGAAALIAALVVHRATEALAGQGNGYDLRQCFAPAGRAVAAGADPYAVECYVYPPLVAVAISPFADASVLHAGWTATMLALGVVSVVATVVTYRGALRGWRAGVLAAVAAVTLLWSWPIVREMHIGGTNLLLLALLTGAVLVEARGRAGAAGALLGAATLVKTWPAALGLWLVRRGAPGRGLAVAAGLAVVVLGLVVGFLPLPPGAAGGWVASTLRLGVQPHPSYSALGLGLELFSDAGAFGDPLLASEALRWTTTALVTVGVAGVLVLALVRPGEPGVALWHVVGCVLLLMPTSHIVYLTLLVPLVWARLAAALEAPRRRELLLLAASLVWWLLAMRPWAPETRAGFTVTAVATLVLVVASVLADARSAPRERSGRSRAPVETNVAPETKMGREAAGGRG